MANFNTHLSVAATASSALALYCIAKDMASITEVPALIAIGTIGGLLPDIDLPNSRPAKMGFAVVSLAVALLSVWLMYGVNLFRLEALMVFGGSYLVVRHVIIAVFNRLTTHRGVVHSVPFVLLCALGLVHLLIHTNVGRADLAGVFLFFGAIIHLLLDEMFSVNAFGLKLKKSFGSALKFIEFKKLPIYIVLYSLCALLWSWLPHSTLMGILHII